MGGDIKQNRSTSVIIGEVDAVLWAGTDGHQHRSTLANDIETVP